MQYVPNLQVQYIHSQKKNTTMQHTHNVSKKEWKKYMEKVKDVHKKYEKYEIRVNIVQDRPKQLEKLKKG